MKSGNPLVLLVLHLAAVSVSAILAGGLSTEAFVFLYGLFGIVLAAIDILVSIGLAFTKNSKQYIAGLLLSAVVLLLTALFSLSQVKFSR